MTSGRQKGKIPDCYSDLTVWPQVDMIALEQSLSTKKFETFESRRKAIEMYVAGKTESPRKFRRPFGVSQVTWPARKVVDSSLPQLRPAVYSQAVRVGDDD